MSTPGFYTSGYVPEAQQRRMANSLMQERMAMPRRVAVASAGDGSVVDVAALEIPAELAYVFSKLHDWTPPHQDNNVTSTAGSLQPMEHNFVLPANINDCVFSKYVDVYFSEEENFFTRIDPIKTPLLPKQNAYEAKESLVLFKLIMRYMNDPNLTAKQEDVLGDYIVQKGITNESLRDELYCQLCNQTFQNSNPDIAERGWVLLANCICCFPPSDTLANYLLKYLSDQAPGNFRALYQHKLLECTHRKYLFPRVYPPCLLEWKTNKKAALMALEAEFKDKVTISGHVESFSTGEEFATHLLKCRDISEGIYGWTVVLDDDGDIYESAGEEYVLDLISEMEVPPQFSHGNVYNLVQIGREASTNRRMMFKDLAHDPLRPRVMELGVEELHHPVHMPAHSVLSPDSLLQHTAARDVSVENWFTTHDEMLVASKLNQRKLPTHSVLSSRSALNVRYTEAARKPNQLYAPVSTNPTPTGTIVYHSSDEDRVGAKRDGSRVSDRLRIASPHRSRGGSSPVSFDSNASTTPQKMENVPPIFSRSLVDELDSDVPTVTFDNNDNKIPISGESPMNRRYRNKAPVDADKIGFPRDTKLNSHNTKQGPVVNGHDDFVSNSGDNSTPVSHQPRYSKNPQIARNGQVTKDLISKAGSKSSVKSGNTDIERWLDRVFDPVLDVTMDGESVQQARAMSDRIKGSRGPTESSKRRQEVEDWSEQALRDSLLTNQGVLSATEQALSICDRLKGGGNDSSQFQAAPPTPFLTNPASTAFFSGPASGSIPLGNLQALADPLVQSPSAYHFLGVQQQAELQSQLQTKQLETQILQQSLQAEILRQQLRHMQAQAPEQPKTPTQPYLPQTPPAETPAAKVAPPVAAKPPAIVHAAPRHSPPLENHVQAASPPPVRKVSRTPGEIDETRAGGVKTLTRNFEHKSHPTVTESHFEKPQAQVPPETHEESKPVKANRQSVVTFSETVAHIPRSESPLSPRSRSDTASSSSSPLPSPRRPMSPPASTHLAPDPGEATAEIPVKIENGSSTKETPEPVPLAVKESDKRTIVDRKGVSRRVRVGKVEWPPRQDEVEKPEPEVGRLLISEQKRKDPDHPQGDFEAAQRRIHEMIKSKQEKPPVVPEKRSDHVKIDMAARQATLEKKLSRIRSAIEEKQPEPQALKAVAQTQTDSALEDAVSAFEAVNAGVLVISTRDGMRVVQTQTGAEPISEHTEKSAFVPYTPSPPDSPLPIEPEPETEDKTEVKRHDEPDLSVLSNARTTLYNQIAGPFYTYMRVPWKLEVRKEVFTPNEHLDDPVLIALVFAQVVQDVFSDSCIRISLDDKIDMRRRLERMGINPGTAFEEIHSVQAKTKVIDSARLWPFYFSRFYPVNGGSHYPSTNLVAVSHNGVKLVKKDTNPTAAANALILSHEIRFDEIQGVCVAKPGIVQLSLKNGSHIMLYTPRAKQVWENIQSFCIEDSKEPGVVVKAVEDHFTFEQDLLSFRVGDRITLDNHDRSLPKGWLYGACHGRCGKFPAGYVTALKKPNLDRDTSRASTFYRGSSSVVDNAVQIPDAVMSESTDDINSEVIPDLRKYILLEYAILNFQKSPFRIHSPRDQEYDPLNSVRQQALEEARKEQHGSGQWNWKKQLEMVTWTKTTPRSTLLKCNEQSMSTLAVSLDANVMQFMGDVSLEKDIHPKECAIAILRALNTKLTLADEVFCMVAKQITDNKSRKSNSTAMGWRLLSLLTAYHYPSSSLKPYLYRFLQDCAADTHNACRLIADRCFNNLETTIKYGGRRNVPGDSELFAILKGRNLQRMMCVLPGASQVLIAVQSATVAQHCINQICDELKLKDQLEREEYTMFYVIEAEHRYCPMTRSEYVLDTTTELIKQDKSFYLLFQRTSWVFPLHLGSGNLYVEMMYNQIIGDYMDGYFVITQGQLPKNTQDDVALLAAYKRRIDEEESDPVSEKNIPLLVPASLHNADNLTKQKWVKLINAKLKSVEETPVFVCRAEFIAILAKWPHFGSTFFTVKGVSGPGIKTDQCLVSVSRQGIKVLRHKTNSVIITYPYEELISSKREKDSNNKTLLRIIHGHSDNPSITRIETNQATAINSLISQYFRILKESGKLGS